MIRVLYVDDESNILELCKIFLERSGDFTVTIATSAPEAIRILGQERFDTIVSDYQMPEMDGIEFLKRLKAEGNTTPVIIFTGKGREEVVIEALNAGAAFYLQKGGGAKSQFAELSHKIKKAVESKRVEEALRRNETRLRGYFNMPLHGIAITSPDKRWVEVNDRICSMLGYTREELSHKNWAELTHPDDLAADVEQFNRVLSGQIEQYTMDKRFIRKDGGVIWTNITIGCVRKSDGNVDYILGLMEDITERKQMVEVLRESERQFRALSENSQDNIMRYDRKHRHIYANPACLRVSGMPAEQFIGKTHRELGFPPDLCALWEPAIDRVFATGQSYRETFAWTGVDGEVVLDWRLFPEQDDGGKVVSVLGVARDITAMKVSEQALRESEERYRAVVEDQSEFICRFTPDGRLTFVNDAYCRYFGLDRSQCLGNSHTVKLTPEDARMMTAHLASLTRENPIGTIQHRIIMPSGEVRWQRWNDRAIFDKMGQVVEYQSVGRDITEIKRAEDALVESETRYREFFTISRDSVFITSPEGRWIDFNDTLVEMFGFESRKEMFEVPVQSIYADPKERSAFTQRIERDGYVKEYPVQLKQKDGTVIDTIITTVPVRNPDGSTKAFIGTIRDITEQKRAEQEIRTLQQFQQSIIDNANVWISVLDPKGTILVWNTTAEQISGYNADEVIGKNTIWKQLYPDPVYRKQVAENILDVIKKNTYVENFETRIRTKSGDEKIIWWNTQPMRDSSGKPVQFIAIGRDNTERREAEERIKALRQFEESVIKNANIWISVLDGRGTVSVWNRAAEEISGFKADEVIGKNTIWSRMYPDKEYRRTVTATIKEVIGANKYLENFETRIRTKDGQERIIWWNTRTLQDVPGINETFIAIGKDVTETKTLSDAVTLANKKLNLLASITRHDIKNQLMALLAYLELSGDGISSPAQQAEYIKKAQQIAGTIERQINLTKDYQEMGIAAPAWQNANESIRKAMAALPIRSVHVEVDPGKPELYADPLFEKVFYNLIDNALRYGGADMKTIRFSSMESATGLTILYEDDGVGISTEDKKKLFTRGFGKHTGLGLFLSREILAITGITITENGTLGKGARFEITVPKGAYRFKGTGGK